MVVNSVNKEKKVLMMDKIKKYFQTYKNYMILNVHKVTSTQIKNFSTSLPSDFKILFVKNKILKKVLFEIGEEKYKTLIDLIKGNILIGFFDGINPLDVYEAYFNNTRKIYAVPGDVAISDIIIPSGPTIIKADKIAYFQAALIDTKLFKGNIDIVTDHILVAKGREVGISQSKLLKMLNILPFEFGLDIIKVFEGEDIYDKNVLLIKENDIKEFIKKQISTISKLSFGTNILTEATLTYELTKSYNVIQKLAFGLSMPLS